MAVVKVTAIKSTLNKAIDYIMNPDKTDGKLLVSSFNCTAETAAIEFKWTQKIATEMKGRQPLKILARHVIQSFAVDEVTPELAHEIGKQFADEILGGKYEYVLCTHIDKGHVHNHLIHNAVDFIEHKAYQSHRKVYYEMRAVSDRLCTENGLSVIPPNQNKGMSYKEYIENRNGTSWKAKLKIAIDSNIKQSISFDHFIKLMESEGYEIKYGKYISFRASDQERFTRGKTLGEYYTEESIKDRILNKRSHRRNLQTVNNSINLLIDIENNIKILESKPYKQWAEIQNLKTLAKTLNYLTDHGLVKYDDLLSKINEVNDTFHEKRCELNYNESQLKKLQETLGWISKYYDTKGKNNTADVTVHRAALRHLKQIYPTKLPNISTLKTERDKLQESVAKLKEEYSAIKNHCTELEKVKHNAESLLNISKVKPNKNKDISL